MNGPVYRGARFIAVSCRDGKGERGNRRGGDSVPASPCCRRRHRRAFGRPAPSPDLAPRSNRIWEAAAGREVTTDETGGAGGGGEGRHLGWKVLEGRREGGLGFGGRIGGKTTRGKGAVRPWKSGGEGGLALASPARTPEWRRPLDAMRCPIDRSGPSNLCLASFRSTSCQLQSWLVLHDWWTKIVVNGIIFCVGGSGFIKWVKYTLYS